MSDGEVLVSKWDIYINLSNGKKECKNQRMGGIQQQTCSGHGIVITLINLLQLGLLVQDQHKVGSVQFYKG